VFEMASLWPTARITLVAVDSRGAEEVAQPLLDGGVEIAAGLDDWEDWFGRRRYHYSVVIVRGAANVERFDEVLRATQPQAAWLHLAEGQSERGPMGWAQLDLADEAEGGSAFRRSLIDAMAKVGIEPPAQDSSLEAGGTRS
jgi:hypothetical protein